MRSRTFACAGVQMIANQVQKRFVGREDAGRIKGETISQRLFLRDEANVGTMGADRLSVSLFVARKHHDADLFNPVRQGLLDENAEDGFLLALAVDEGLQRERSLVRTGGRNHCFCNLHSKAFRQFKQSGEFAAMTSSPSG
jgi:hypothetical protein